MASNLVLGVRMVPNQFQRIKLENVDLDSTVQTLRDEAAKKINTEKQSIDLIYCGIVLEDDSTISSYGVKSGVMIHVLAKKEKPKTSVAKPLSEVELHRAYQAFAQNYNLSFQSALQRVARPEVLDKIIAATPGLAEDPVAIAMIQDFELLIQLADKDRMRKINQTHPTVIEAINHIATHFQKEATSSNSTQPSTSTGYSYSLDALSDDEEMDSSSSDPPRDGHGLTRNSSYSAITAAQLAAALSAAARNPTGTTPNSGGTGIITNEMFTNAIQQAFATASSPTTPPVVETSDTLRTRYREQLDQMQEIGLTNEARNIRALQTTSGDVQAAIDLVFNGVID